MNISKSIYCQGIQCKKILWLNKYKKEERTELNNNSVLENGTKVGEVAKHLFGEYINIDYNDNLSLMLKDTQKIINNNNHVVITEASFNYESNFCSVDILIKKDNDYEIYEVKSSTELKDIYLDDISYQRYVLSNLGYNIKKASIVHINSNYIRYIWSMLRPKLLNETAKKIVSKLEDPNYRSPYQKMEETHDLIFACLFIIFIFTLINIALSIAILCIVA